MHRSGWARTGATLTAAILTTTAVLVGCSAPPVPSRIDEYSTRAEEVHAAMLDRVPGAVQVSTTSAANFGEPGPFGPRAHDVASWSTESTVEVAGDTSSAEAATAVGAVLVERGWAAEPTGDVGGTTPLSTVYRRPEADGEWIVEIAWQPQDDDRRIIVMVHSPLTVRGST